MSLDKLKERVEALSEVEFREFRSWLHDHAFDRWDRQIEDDYDAGRLDGLVAEALADHGAGRTIEL